MEDLFTLYGLLAWLSGVGAGVLASFLLEKWRWYQAWNEDFWKIVIALAAPAPIALFAYLGMIALAYQEPPGDPRSWAEQIYAIMAAAIIGQLSHKLRQARARSD